MRTTKFKIKVVGFVMACVVCLAVAGIGAIAVAGLFIYEFCKLAFA